MKISLTHECILFLHSYRSNAEYLQGLVPEAKVVKGFNVLSAYALESGGLQGSKEVGLSDCQNIKNIKLYQNIKFYQNITVYQNIEFRQKYCILLEILPSVRNK